MSSLGETSGLVGGEETAVPGGLSGSLSVFVDAWLEVEGLGRSGALYESIFVVCRSSMGPEILGRSVSSSGRMGPPGLVLGMDVLVR